MGSYDQSTQDSFQYVESLSESSGGYGSKEDDAEIVENVLEMACTGAIMQRSDGFGIALGKFFKMIRKSLNPVSVYVCSGSSSCTVRIDN